MKALINKLLQPSTRLYNGEVVKEGDWIQFTNSDGQPIKGQVQRRQHDYTCPETGKKLSKGTLGFHNHSFDISVYKNATKLLTHHPSKQ